jgi:hypothetical protein
VLAVLPERARARANRLPMHHCAVVPVNAARVLNVDADLNG